MLTKITKKEFIELLKNNSSWFIQSALNQKTDRKTACENCFNQWDTEKIKSLNPYRAVEKATTSKILFCDGSALDFNQYGSKTYYKYNTNGGAYILQETITFDEFDNENRYHYIIYLIQAGYIPAYFLTYPIDINTPAFFNLSRISHTGA